MNIEQTKSIFDICFKDDTQNSDYQIQVPYDNSTDCDVLLLIIAQLFRAKLVDIYTREYLFTGGSKKPEFMNFLGHHYDKSTSKNEFLTLFERLILPEAKETVEALQILTDEKERYIFNSFINIWLNEQRTLLAIDDTITRSPMAGVAAADNGQLMGTQTLAPANFYIPAEILFKIHEKFNGVLWEPIDQMAFISVFDTNNGVQHSWFKIKQRKTTDFYALLWHIHKFRQQGRYEDFIFPLLKRYGLSAKSFENIRKTRIDLDPDENDKEKKKKNKLNNEIMGCLK